MTPEEVRRLYAGRMEKFLQEWVAETMGDWFSFIDSLEDVRPNRAGLLQDLLEKSFYFKKKYISGLGGWDEFCDAAQSWAAQSVFCFEEGV